MMQLPPAAIAAGLQRRQPRPMFVQAPQPKPVQPVGPVIDPKALEQRRQLAEAMLKGSMGVRNIEHPFQGYAQLAEAIVGGMKMRNAESQAQERAKAVAAARAGLFDGQGDPMQEALSSEYVEDLAPIAEIMQRQAERKEDRQWKLDDRAFDREMTERKFAMEQQLMNQRLAGQGSEPTRYQQGGTFQLPDGSVVPGMFDPQSGYVMRNPDGSIAPLPADARPVTPSTGAPLSQKQFNNLEMELATETKALSRMQEYFDTVGGMNQGVQLLADQFVGALNTAMGNGLTPDQLKAAAASGQLQALLGLNREDIAGPGVMTEYDAQRVINALGGDVGMLQNKQVVAQLLGGIFASKADRVRILQSQYERNRMTYGAPDVPAPQMQLDTGAITQPGDLSTMSDEELLRLYNGGGME